MSHLASHQPLINEGNSLGITSELNLTYNAEHANWHGIHIIQLPARAARRVPLTTLLSGEAVRNALQHSDLHGI